MDAKERVQEFDRAHGESVSDGAWRYYADGSVREVGLMGLLLGAEFLDLNDFEREHELRRNQLRFHELYLQRAVEAFEELNTNLSQTTAIGAAEIKELSRLQKVVEGRRLLVAKAEEMLAATRKGERQAAIREGQKQEQLRMAEFQKQRREIRI